MVRYFSIRPNKYTCTIKGGGFKKEKGRCVKISKETCVRCTKILKNNVLETNAKGKGNRMRQ